MTLSIVIPAYNEEKTIHLILNKIMDTSLITGLKKEIIIVNDCSSDHTELAIQQYITEHPSLIIQYYRHAVSYTHLTLPTNREV